MANTAAYNKVMSNITPELCTSLVVTLIRHKHVLDQRNPTCPAWLTNKMKSLGLLVEHHYPTAAQTRVPGLTPTSNPLIIGITGNRGRPTLMFETHYDTQTIEPSSWDVDPFAGVVSDGRIYGRGTVDSKGQLAMMIAAIEAIKKAGVELSGRLILACSPDGEFGGSGWSYLADCGLADETDWIICGEATYWEENQRFQIAVAHYGSFAFQIDTLGIASHSWRDQRVGVHALWEMNKVINALDQMKITHEPWKYHEPRISLNTLGYNPHLRYGEELRCTLTGRVTVVPGMSARSVRQDIKKVLDDIQRQDGKLKYELTVTPGPTPTEVAADDLAVKSIQEATTDIHGKEPTLGLFELVYCGAPAIFTRANPGELIGKPTPITFGGGDFNLAHNGNESARVENLVQTAKIYARAILDLVG